MEDLLDSYQLKKSLKYILIIGLIVFISLEVFINIVENQYKLQIMKEEAMLIGSINNIDEDVTKEVLGIVTKGKYDEEVANEGRKILESYGYKEDTYFKNIDNNLIEWYLIIFFISIIILLIIKEIISYNLFNNEINKLNDKLELIISGDYKIRIEDNLEGSFYRLTRNINRLVSIVQGSITTLNKEKLFLKDMISDISHQLKTPVSSLILYNELLSQHVLEDNQEDEILENSSIVIEKMQWLIINLLKITKFEVNSVLFNKKEIEIKKLLNGAIEKLKGLAMEKKVNLILNGEDSKIEIDKEWTEEALINIIKNGIEHSEKGSNLEINLESNLAEVKISIKDFGEGISEIDKKNIFKRFYRGQSSKKDSVGIGLAMAKTIIEKQDGTIKVKSEKNRGSEFIITFIRI